jgi:hypothetical protein
MLKSNVFMINLIFHGFLMVFDGFGSQQSVSLWPASGFQRLQELSQRRWWALRGFLPAAEVNHGIRSNESLILSSGWWFGTFFPG